MKLKNLQRLVYVSAVIVAIGVFLPLASIPVYGTITYNRVAAAESIIVIVFAFSAPVLLQMRKPQLLIVSALGVWGTILFPALEGAYRSHTQGTVGKLADAAASPVQDFAAKLLLNVTTFDWGGIVFLGSCVVFALACGTITVKTTKLPKARKKRSRKRR